MQPLQSAALTCPTAGNTECYPRAANPAACKPTTPSALVCVCTSFVSTSITPGAIPSPQPKCMYSISCMQGCITGPLESQSSFMRCRPQRRCRPRASTGSSRRATPPRGDCHWPGTRARLHGSHDAKYMDFNSIVSATPHTRMVPANVTADYGPTFGRGPLWALGCQRPLLPPPARPPCPAEC